MGCQEADRVRGLAAQPEQAQAVGRARWCSLEQISGRDQEGKKKKKKTRRETGKRSESLKERAQANIRGLTRRFTALRGLLLTMHWERSMECAIEGWCQKHGAGGGTSMQSNST